MLEELFKRMVRDDFDVIFIRDGTLVIDARVGLSEEEEACLNSIGVGKVST